MPTRERITHVSTYNSAANNGEGAWNEAVPIGAETDNLDVSTGVTNGGNGSISNTTIENGVIVTGGDTETAAWTKFNTFVQRVKVNFNNFLGKTIRTGYNASYGDNDIYSASVLNSFMSNVVGYTQTTTPSTGTIAAQINNRVRKTGEDMTGTLALNGPTLVEGTSNLIYIVRSTDYSRGDVIPANKDQGAFVVQDKNNTFMGRATTTALGSTAGLSGSALILESRTKKTDNTNFSNGLTLRAWSNGVADVILNATAWHKALGLGTNGALPITVAQGGTGSTTITGAVKQFFNADNNTDTTHFLSIKGDWSKAGYISVAQARNKMGLGNTTGALAIANGGTGATTQVNAFKAITGNINITTPNYVTSLTNNWAKTGYTSLSDLRNTMGLGSGTGALPIANGGTGQTAVTVDNTAANILTVGSGYSITEVNFRKWGKIANIRIVLNATAAHSNDHIIATLKSGYRPATYVSGLVWAKTQQFAIYPSGEVHVVATSSASIANAAEVMVMATYVLS